MPKQGKKEVALSNPVKTTDLSSLGMWAFYLGLVLVLLTSVLQALQTEITNWVLVVLGFLVALVNLKTESTVFFIASFFGLIAVKAAGLENLPMLGAYLLALLQYLVVFLAPSVLVLSLKTIWKSCRS